ILVEPVHVSVQANRISRELCRKLRGNGAHASGGNGGVAFGKHFEEEFEHATGGFEFRVEENAAKKWTEETMNEFLGESEGLQGVFGGTFRPGENLVDRLAAQARAQTRDADFV